MDEASAAAETLAAARYEEASGLGRALLAGAERIFLPASEPGVELAALDWNTSAEAKGSDPRPLAVLHHANGFCAATLAQLAVGLASTYRVVSIDARGHGDSTSVAPAEPEDVAAGAPDPYAWGTLAADLEAVTAALLARTGHARISLGIGHSLGGALTLRLATIHPDRFERILLLDPVILPPLPPETQARASKGNSLAIATRKRRDRFATAEEAFEHCRSRGLFAEFTPEALALYVDSGMRTTAEGDLTLKCDRDVEAAIFDGGARYSVVADLERVTAEVFLVHAKRGNFSRSYYDEIVARLEKGRVETLDVGHLFPLEQPARVLELIEEKFPRGANDG